MLVGRGAAMVIGDLAEMGYDSQWCIVSASDLGAPHQRDRFWLLAHTNDYEYRTNGRQKGKEDGIQGECRQEGLARQPCRASCDTEILADTNSSQRQGDERTIRGKQERANTSKPSWWASEPDVGRVANGMAARVDRLKAIGNGQVSCVAATAFNIMRDR